MKIARIASPKFIINKNVSDKCVEILVNSKDMKEITKKYKLEANQKSNSEGKGLYLKLSIQKLNPYKKNENKNSIQKFFGNLSVFFKKPKTYSITFFASKNSSLETVFANGFNLKKIDESIHEATLEKVNQIMKSRERKRNIAKLNSL